MKIVIDIPEGAYEEICKAEFPIHERYRLVNWIKDGMPLPKGHGRLIDAKQAEERLRQAFDEHEGYNSLARFIVRNPSETPTIIEADKEGKE